MRKALFVLTTALIFAVACAAPADSAEEPAANSEADQTANSAEQTQDTQPEANAASKRTFCIDVSTYLNIVDSNLYEMVGYANAGLDDELNVRLLYQQAEIAASISNDVWGRLSFRVPKDAEKLGRSIDKYNEKLTEFNFDANSGQLNDRKTYRGLEDLVDDFLDVHGKVEDYCGS